ncbi:putative endoplasmic reticulum protein [Filobasidium floriforme]|uniref:putative endoplasmic reticulum protein n=1 Tax=Filobasidium floriforme TaxID=5210 RepID=UPI001E8E6F57|nr:putative endoplasmic reticulum protein [Filobasidium floriforme]KAH8086823.1 putative endoplasmic reticulum protein [Filobasidium floriforme]
MSISKSTPIADPPCFAPFSTYTSSTKRNKKALASTQDDSALELAATTKSNDLKLKKAWEVALAPAKSLPMQAIMLYMSGSGIQIFSMGIVWMLLTSPFKACFQIIKTFEPYRQVTATSSASSRSISTTTSSTPTRKGKITPDLLTAMLVYVGCQALVLGLGIYKCKQMGLVPTGTGDWLQFESRAPAPEWSAVRFGGMGAGY